MSEPTITDWINSLPPIMRDYIHDLETRCDPAGDVRTIAELRDTIRALEAQINELQPNHVQHEGQYRQLIVNGRVVPPAPCACESCKHFRETVNERNNNAIDRTSARTDARDLKL